MTHVPVDSLFSVILLPTRPMVVKLLVVFLSCRKNRNLWGKLLQIVPNSIILCGSDKLTDTYQYNNRILMVKCPDTYDYLPTKVYLMIQSVLSIGEFQAITHLLKLDDRDTQLNPKINQIVNRIPLTDYCGQRIHNQNGKKNGTRTWHFGKCPRHSPWYNKPYTGNYVPWLHGGCGYILSRKAMKLLSETRRTVINKHIYEDVMIALLLHQHGIFPTKLPKIIEGDMRD